MSVTSRVLLRYGCGGLHTISGAALTGISRTFSADEHRLHLLGADQISGVFGLLGRMPGAASVSLPAASPSAALSVYLCK